MVAAWYDQSGNSMDISILSIASQPFYVSSGVNGKPAIHSTTTSHYY
jgi:hypothetical protein